MAHLEGTAQSAGFVVISQSPDVCKSPGTPIPYNIVGFLDKSILTSTNVRFQGFRVFDTMSRVATVVGNEAGIGGGVASQTNLGMCKPVAGPSTTVLCNGNQICRHDTAIYEMNLLGPNGSSNTIGKVYYLGAMMSGPVGPKGAMPDGANGNIPAKSPSELSALDKIKNSLSIDSIEDAVSMSQKAYDLGQVDWGNPSAALGALAGMAGSADLGDLAEGIGAVNKVMNTDWDDPASVLAAAGALAGPVMKASQAASDYFGDEEPLSQTGPANESTPPFVEESSQQDVPPEDVGLLPISEPPTEDGLPQHSDANPNEKPILPGPQNESFAEPPTNEALQTTVDEFNLVDDLLNPPPEQNSCEMDRVEVHSNSLYGVLDHTYIAVYKDGEVTTIAGRDHQFSDDLGGMLRGQHPLSIDINNYAADLNNSNWNQEISPPPEMSHSEFANSVIQAGNNAQYNSDTTNYSLTGGDYGQTSGNCHTTTNNIIRDAGGTVPASLNTPAIASPGLHGPPDS